MNPPPVPPSIPPSYAPQPGPLPPKSGGGKGVIIAVVVIAVVLGLIVIVAILAALALPAISAATNQAKAVQTMSNARQFQMAAYRMVLDNSAAPDPALGWPGDLAKSSQRPVVTVADYIDRLVEYRYLNRADLPKLLAAPGVPPYTGTGPFASAYSPFKIYRATDEDPGDCLLIATRNYTFGENLNPTAPPSGYKSAVVVQKDGSGRVVRQAQAEQKVGHLPGDADGNSPREEKPSSTLKM